MNSADLEAVLAADGALGEGGSVTPEQIKRAQQRGARRRAARRRAVKASRTLRRDVRRMRGCLSLLPPAQRTVLVLRANLGGPAPASRSTVAQQVGTSVARVRGLERAGLRRLRRGCGGGVVTGGGGQTIAFEGADRSAFAGVLGDGRRTGSRDDSPQARTASDASQVAGAVASASPASVVTRGDAAPGETGGWPFVLLLATLAGLAALTAVTLLRPGRAADIPQREPPLVAPPPARPSAEASPPPGRVWNGDAPNGSPTTDLAPPAPLAAPPAAPPTASNGADGSSEPVRHRARTLGAGALAVVALELARRRLRR